jgi:hypothetical protein
MKKLIFAIFLLLLAMNCFSQINLAWNKKTGNTYNFAGNPSDKSIVIDLSGNIYNAAYMKDSSNNWVLKINKYSSTGEFKWEKALIINILYSVDFYPCFIRILNNDRIVIMYNYFDTCNYNNIGILVYDTEGNQTAIASYNNNGNGNSFLQGATTDNFGNIYLTGYTTDGYEKVVTLKYNSSGNLIWERTINSFSFGKDIITDTLGNIYVCGAIDSATTQKYFMLTAKYNSSGVLLWKKLYGYINGTISGEDIATRIHLDDSLNVIVGGSCFTNGYRFTLVKYKNNGDFRWGVLYSTLMEVDYIASDSRCNIYVSGFQESTPCKIIKYSPNGLVTSTFSSSTISPYLIKYYRTNYLYIAGNQNESGLKNSFYFAVIDTNLNVLSSHSYSLDTSISNYYHSITFDRLGNIILNGVSKYDSLYMQLYKLVIMKLSQTVLNINTFTNIPDNFSLSQNYPNPFNPSTNIKYQITDNKFVTLKVYDILGKEVATLVNEKQNAGTYEATFDGSKLTSGIYFYKLTCEDFSETKKMLMIK